MDLDSGMEWTLASEPTEVFSLDFNSSQAALMQALQERDISFLMRPSGHRGSDSLSEAAGPDGMSAHKEAAQAGTPQALGPCRCNAVAWWFEADVSSSTPALSSAPCGLRPAGSEATHWAQAVAGLGPWSLAGALSVRMRVRTDGVSITWTPLGLEECCSNEPWLGGASDSKGAPLLGPLVHAEAPLVATAELEAWRQAGAEAADALRLMRRRLDEVGDLARLQALQSAVLHLAAQPGIFGLEATPDAVATLLKDFFA